MPEGDRYVTDGALLRCDKGPLVTPLTVLPRPSRVNGRFQANTLDCVPVVNIKPFGVCAITHGPCLPVMPTWTQAHPAGRTIGPGPAAPLLESSVCQCALGGCISITVLPVPGMPNAGTGGGGLEAEGAALAQQQQAREQAQDEQAHALSGELKEAAGDLAVFGLVCVAVGLVFPPVAAVGAVALELSEAALVAGVAVDVAVAIDHPTQDNWVTVGGDALALATGYVVGKVIVGPALGALSRWLTPAIKEEVATGIAAGTALTVPAAVEGRVLKSPETQFGKLRMAYEYYKQAGWDKTKIAGHLQGIDFAKPVEQVELPANKVAGQLQANPAWKGNYFAEPGTDATRLGINPQGKLPDGTVVDKVETIYSTTETTTVLRSSAAPVNDTWSMQDAPYQTEGGALRWSGETGENWVLTSQTHGKSPSHETAAL